MNSEVQEALNNYRVDQNRERGHSMEDQEMAMEALKSACTKHGVDLRDVLSPKLDQVEIQGPAQVVSGAAYGRPYILEVFDINADIERSISSGRMLSGIPAGMGRSFDLMPGVSVVDHRQVA